MMLETLFPRTTAMPGTLLNQLMVLQGDGESSPCIGNLFRLP